MNFQYAEFIKDLRDRFWNIANQKSGYTRQQAMLLICDLEEDLKFFLPKVNSYYCNHIAAKKTWGCHQVYAVFLHVLLDVQTEILDELTKTSLQPVVEEKETAKYLLNRDPVKYAWAKSYI